MAFAAWAAGSHAKLDNEQRVVPETYQKYADEWLAGYDGKNVL